MQISLSTHIRYLKGIGPKRAQLLSGVGINTVEDLFYYFPRRYEDRRNIVSISALKKGEVQTIKAQVVVKGQRRSWRRQRFSITEAVVADKTGRISCVWFNQPYLNDYFKVGQVLILYGRVEYYANKLQMSSPEFELVAAVAEDQSKTLAQKSAALKDSYDEPLSIGRIVPVYSLPDTITQRNFRKIVKCALDIYLSKVADFLPYSIRGRNNLLNLARSLLNIHFPETPEMQKQAVLRLSFEEFLLFQLPLVLRKLKARQQPGIAHDIEGRLLDCFIESLPFKLTKAQQKVITQIKADMAKPIAMQRLLEGDVGSGKTVVATIAAIAAIQGGYQAAFMVPTEILSRQHFDKISYQLSAIPATDMGGSAKYFGGSYQQKIKVGLLTSSANKKEKKKICQEISDGTIDLVVGTHALLEEGIEFKNLGLVVIDEQHKFGVGQRALLSKKGRRPDVLIMTATPIPRTLAITLYGDLDLSIIDELPPGRGTIKTLKFNTNQWERVYSIVKEQVRSGNQAYIVYPVIEESYALDMAGAKKRYEELKTGEFREFKLGLIHGRLKQAEQDQIMLKFKNKELDVLVSTTVLEVGIDIPDATCMIIEHAERFGLAQLHQLRGRVGRGRADSFCVLVSDTENREASARLEAMVRCNDGFRIAEEDLKIRGPGEFFGQRQHGLSELKIANPLAQMHLLKNAREEAIKLLNSDPHLEARPNNLLKDKLLQRFPEYEKLIVVG